MLDLLLGCSSCLLDACKLALGVLECLGAGEGLLVLCTELCEILFVGGKLRGEFGVACLSSLVLGIELLEALLEIVLLL